MGGVVARPCMYVYVYVHVCVRVCGRVSMYMKVYVNELSVHSRLTPSISHRVP